MAAAFHLDVFLFNVEYRRRIISILKKKNRKRFSINDGWGYTVGKARGRVAQGCVSLILRHAEIFKKKIK